MADLRKEPGKDIYCDGDSETIKEMLKYSLIDKMIISIIPHLLESGIRLFRDGLPEQNIKLVNSQTFASGLVQLSYEKANLKADRV
ncbi:MAG: dihydrofolate reductase family protein [Daejeonella sp.]|nr:dihydrofolate reductase family protein [Daejeonella sp.]MDP3469696.1 dihydrofolate reductase family protein [Daejeonella sp.]